MQLMFMRLPIDGNTDRLIDVLNNNAASFNAWMGPSVMSVLE